MDSYPTNICPGCMNGTCASHGLKMFYPHPPYYGHPDELALLHLPSGAPPPVYTGFYQANDVYPIYPPQFYGGYQTLPQPYVGQCPIHPRGKKRYSTNKNHKMYYSQPLDGNNSSAMESAIMFVKTRHHATLFSIDGIVAEVAAADDGALRFVQDRIQVGSDDERQIGLKAALASFGMLSRDFRGNRLIQALIDYGSPEEKKELMAAIQRENPLDLSMHKHGCRVIQSAITSIDHEDLVNLVSKFQGLVLTLIHDPNGNHVIQRCIEAISAHINSAEDEGDAGLASNLTAKLQFIIDDVIENVEQLSVHSYGCRVVQRALEFCKDDQKQQVLSAIIKCNKKLKLLTDQFGNYVLQQAIVTGDETTRDIILKSSLNENGPESLLLLSKHKYASNVIEKLVQFGSSQQRDIIIKESLKARDGSSVCVAVDMAKDNIANYVIKTVIECARLDQKKQILEELSFNLVELSKYPQASYIFNKESASASSP